MSSCAVCAEVVKVTKKLQTWEVIQVLPLQRSKVSQLLMFEETAFQTLETLLLFLVLLLISTLVLPRVLQIM